MKEGERGNAQTDATISCRIEFPKCRYSPTSIYFLHLSLPLLNHTFQQGRASTIETVSTSLIPFRTLYEQSAYDYYKESLLESHPLTGVEDDLTIYSMFIVSLSVAKLISFSLRLAFYLMLHSTAQIVS